MPHSPRLAAQRHSAAVTLLSVLLLLRHSGVGLGYIATTSSSSSTLALAAAVSKARVFLILGALCYPIPKPCPVKVRGPLVS